MAVNLYSAGRKANLPPSQTAESWDRLGLAWDLLVDDWSARRGGTAKATGTRTEAEGERE